MKSFSEHLIRSGSSIKSALEQLDILAKDAILFVVDTDQHLLGSLTDGDVRRGLLKEVTINHAVDEIIQLNPKFIQKDNYDLNYIVELRNENFKIIPVVDNTGTVVNVINLRKLKSYLPVDAVIMAGGTGSRLRPMTDTVPKPLLQIGDKPIIDHNVDRLISFGIDDIWVSVKYLGEQIESFLGDGHQKNIRINYIWEKEPLGTIGALRKAKNFKHDYVLVSNSDLLTNLNYEDFFLDFLKKGADLSVVSIPYAVNVPYAVLETKDGRIYSFKEKPTYTYYSNGGIYMMKKEMISKIPLDKFYDATDLLQSMIEDGSKVITFPCRDYWLDIGKPEDYKKAQRDIKHINF
ncbi:MAG: nucleotidyltransferase family protein [Cyclobacteriaceae bacterium]